MPDNAVAAPVSGSLRGGSNFLSQAWDNAADADSLSGRNAIAAEAADNAGICVLAQTADLTYCAAENLPACLRGKWRAGCAEEDIFPADVAAEMRHIKLQILAGSPPAKLEAELPPDMDAGGLCLRFFINARRDRSGAVTGIVMAGADISELRARDEAIKALLREVSHRSKNLLAIIQSIAAQTARFSPGGDFLKKFQGRLHSLSASQDLITASDWRGARLRELLKAQMRACAAAGGGAGIRAEGENPHLLPSAALYIGLALHELIANSAAFGALAKAGGGITLLCLRDKAGGCGLALKWTENFPAGEEADYKKPEAGFGSAVLERIAPSAAGGRAAYSVGQGNVEYSLTISDKVYSA